jgi:alcohol dehydrogenase (NADP+)
MTFARSDNITADTEVIPIQKNNQAYERVVKKDVKYRFVVNLSSLNP